MAVFYVYFFILSDPESYGVFISALRISLGKYGNRFELRIQCFLFILNVLRNYTFIYKNIVVEDSKKFPVKTVVLPYNSQFRIHLKNY